MKTLFIEARKKVELQEKDIRELSKSLPISLGLISTVQYVPFLPKIKKILEKQGKKVFISKGKLTKYSGQILGCDASAAEKIKDKVKCFLFVGSGDFHLGRVMLLEKDIFVFNINNGKINKITTSQINEIKIKKKSALMKVLSADKVGIIVSIKPGQYNLKSALSLKKKLEKKGKVSFIFLTDNIDLNELDNFDCSAWINTSCQALNMEPKILNMIDLKL